MPSGKRRAERHGGVEWSSDFGAAILDSLVRCYGRVTTGKATRLGAGGVDSAVGVAVDVTVDVATGVLVAVGDADSVAVAVAVDVGVAVLTTVAVIDGVLVGVAGRFC